MPKKNNRDKENIFLLQNRIGRRDMKEEGMGVRCPKAKWILAVTLCALIPTVSFPVTPASMPVCTHDRIEAHVCRRVPWMLMTSAPVLVLCA